MMQLGAEGVFVGSGIFKSEDPQTRANAIVKAVTNYRDAEHHRRGLAWVSARRCRASTRRACPKKPRSSIAAGEPRGRHERGNGRRRLDWILSPGALPRLARARVPAHVGVLALQGDFREHRVDARAARRAHP